MTDLREVVARIADGGPVRPTAGGFMVRCPAHADGTPSLSITEGIDQPIILHCHASCETDAILDAAGLTWADISAEQDHQAVRAEWTPNGPAVAIYDYTDENGVLLSQVLRSANKGFSQRVPDTTRPSGWRWSLGDVRRVLYRLPAVIEGVAAGAEVFITEGEKDADNLVRRAGVCATTSIGGAGKWRHEYAEHLRDASVTMWSDTDDQGRAHARVVRQSLLDAGARQVRVVESAHGKDATDHLDAGLGLDAVLVTHPYQEETEPNLAMDLDEYLGQVMPAQQFVIHETLARGEVMMVTGFEGFGKSTLMKQLAVQIACGVHPWSGDRMPPSRVLMIDAENKTPDNFADFTRLRWIASHHADMAAREPLYIIECGPLDLGKEEHLLWFLERVRAHAPDVLVIGPVYNLVARDLRSEDDARVLKASIDMAQKIGGCAVIMEHHVPHGGPEGRDLRPIGSSLLMRWPNFGFGLAPIKDAQGQFTGIAEWQPWRGGRRRSRRWPQALRVGSSGVEWMWEQADPLDVAQARATQGRR